MILNKSKPIAINNKKKILVVDNHPMLLNFMVDLLEKEGHTVVTANSGLEALDILKEFVPDILFIDLVMPNISGDKLCGIVRKMPTLKKAYIVVLSAIAAEEKTIKFNEFGADACIAKGPFNKMDKHIREILSQADQENRTCFSGKILGLTDVHSRTITKELLSVKRHFEIILGSMSEGILEISREARIVYANPVAVSLSGMPEENLLASNLIELFHHSDHESIKALLESLINTLEQVVTESPLTLNGRQVTMKILPLRSETNKYIVMFNDITDHLRREVELREFQKMEAIGTLAAGIAHDFNNLLMGIQGSTSLMLLDINKTHSHFAKLKSIEKQVQSGSKLTHQLLGYARKGKFEVSPFDVNNLIKETAETFGRAKKEITIRQELDEDLLFIEADMGQMEQVLLNLYVNAANAMPYGGKLIITTQNSSHKYMIDKIYEPKPGNYVMLTITDEGIGMDQETVGRIFDPFFTTREMGRGTGLGLASVYGIIKGHGGYIDVQSQKEKGTTFKIYLPGVKQGKKKAVPIEPKSTNTAVRLKTVLLVDDEDYILEVTTELLKAMGYQVLIAKNGNEAINIYEKNHDIVDLVVLDMIMPSMSGSEVFDRLKAIKKDIRVLLSSGYSIDGEAKKILERGCERFIQKPFNMQELERNIKAILCNGAGNQDLRSEDSGYEF